MRLGWTAAVTLLLATVPAWGQEEVLPDLFSDVIDVRVVNVEVVVTDRKGNRIRGLEAKDFELLVDGEPAPIEYFTEVDNGRAQGSADDGAGNVPSLLTGEPVGTNYLVFIDDLFAIRQSRNRVLKHLGQDLDRLGPADRVAVVAFDGRNLTRITDWTYMDMSKSTEVTMLVEGSLLFGGAPGADALDVRFGTPEKAGFRKIAVPMEVSIPLDDVELLPMGGQWMNELEFRVTVIDEHGDRSDTPVESFSIAGPTVPEAGDVFVYETNLFLRKREHRFVAAVYDPLTGAILSASGEVGPR